MELGIKNTNRKAKTKRGTRAFNVHFPEELRDALIQFVVARNTNVSELMRELIITHMKENGCELPDNIGTMKRGRRPSKKESIAVEAA